MQAEVYEALKEKLGDAKIAIDGEEKTLLDQVADWELGVTKTRAANKDLTGQREQWEAERKEFKTKLEEIATAKAELEKKIQESNLSDEDKKRLEKLKNGSLIDHDTYQKQVNTLESQLKELTEQLNSEKQNREAEAQKVKEAAFNGEIERLRNDIITELTKHNIIGQQADIAWNTIKAKGMAKVEDGETGFLRSFTVIKDGKELNSDIADLCKRFADENRFLVSTSNRTGTNTEHRSNSNTTGNNRNYRSMIYNK